MIWLPDRFFWWLSIVGPKMLSSCGGQKVAFVQEPWESGFTIFLPGPLAAQGCSMCKAVAEESGFDVNPGIVLLIIVPYAAGGAVDVVGRLMAPRMGELLGQSFVIDNRGGAGGNIGAQLVAKAAPEGYTILVTTSGVIVTNKSI